MIDQYIPKIIHYCWFGHGKYDERLASCIESWSRVCPDYQIMKWDEETFDLESCLYVKQAYDKRRFAFVTDYVRFKVLKEFGGFYVDTDVEFVKSLNDMLNNSTVMSFKQMVEGMKKPSLTSAVIGSMKNNPLFDSLIEQFENRSYLNENGEEDITPVAKFLTDLIVEHGFSQDNLLQQKDGIVLYPNDYLCPTIATDGSGVIEVTENTHAIHYFSGMWRTPEIMEMLMNKIKNAKDGENVV